MGVAVVNKTASVKIAKMPNGIMVRIESVATTKIEANRLPAAFACCARCEVSIGDQPNRKGSPAIIKMSAVILDMSEKKPANSSYCAKIRKSANQ
jgi:hypothetical protein